MSRTREERRKNEHNKFISRVKNIFETNHAWRRFFNTWREMAKDGMGLLYKHTRTPITYKSSWDKAEERRLHKKEKNLSKREIMDAVRYGGQYTDEI